MTPICKINKKYTNPILLETQAARPAMLSRRTYDHVLAIHMAGVMEGTTVDFRGKPSRWPAALIISVLALIGWQFRGMI